jgi:hypothetical protein
MGRWKKDFRKAPNIKEINKTLLNNVSKKKSKENNFELNKRRNRI